MSTRSGKRIHTSLLEDTAAPEVECVAKSERKTRSKRVKDLDEISIPLFKNNKKRNNYVSYPHNDEPLAETANKKDGETKQSRATRKNALKEHNTVENGDQLESDTEGKHLTRKSRHFKRRDDAEETENHENIPDVTEVPKSKKSKKKKKVETLIDNPIEEHPQVTEEAPAKKSKKKKKKGKGSNTMIVEDVPQHNNSKNRSMSVDSFHSAAGSPYKDNIDTKPANELENAQEVIKPSKANRKKNKKNSNNNTFDKNDQSVNMEVDIVDESKKKNKSTKKRKPAIEETTLDQCFVSVARDDLDKGLEDIVNASKLPNGHMKRRKFDTRDATFDKSNISANLENDAENSLNISNMSKRQSKRRKSSIKEANEILPSRSEEDNAKNNDVFDKGLRSRNSDVKDVTFDKSNTSAAKDILENSVDIDDSNVSKNHLKKTRRSLIKDSTFDKSNTSFAKEIIDRTADVDDSNISNKYHKTRKSLIKDSTFDKSNTSIAKETIESTANVDDSNVSNKHHKTRKSLIKDSTFDKSNASISKEPAEEIEANFSGKKARKSMPKDSTFDKSNASIANGNITEDIQSELNVSNKQLRRRKSDIKDSTFDKVETLLNTTFEKETENAKGTVKDSTFNKSNTKHPDTTYEKDLETDTSSKRKEKKSSVNTTFDKTDKDTTFEKDTSSTFDAFKKGAMTRKSSIRDASFDKGNISIASVNKEDFEKDHNIISSSATKQRSIRRTFDKNDTISENVNTTYEKTENTDQETKRKSPRLSKPDIQTVLNTTFEKEITNDRKESLISSSKSSLISSDNSSITDKSNDMSRISITSDDTSEHVENIVNTTPLLIESSIDESHTSITKPVSPKPQTPLKREGTFTKEVPEESKAEVETPTKRKSSVSAAGCTPFHVGKSSQKKTILNVTRSLEKGVRAMVDPAPRLTKVMFCSPVDNPVTFTQEKRKIIKSNLKGSNKSFVFDENASMSRPARKRSYTQNDADDSRVKRTRLTEDLQHSVDRLSRPRTASATAKLAVTPKKPVTPSKPKSEGKPPRTKLPNFAAMHQKQFDKMESLDECQERRAKRAKQLLTPTAPPGLLERISPKNNTESPKKQIKELAKPKEKTDTPTKKLPTLESLRPGFTRFGFKLNLEVNPFSIPSKTVEKPKEKPVEKPNGIVPKLLPSLAGATSVRREVAKLTVMREKSFTDKRNVTRNANRTIIKGVRTNRRFELQMKMRNIE